eukprot:TRINITY_DN21705_c0_g1_i2.p1 TRINITY_DN21705_c0_g1~~TRINITY_DN21705_c0_g1_i2.p1  ORF type:complete len:672 (+),score=75.24 TRINITY_DN21705_c0_g1_i2:118-2133(+)
MCWRFLFSSAIVTSHGIDIWKSDERCDSQRLPSWKQHDWTEVDVCAQKKGLSSTIVLDKPSWKYTKSMVMHVTWAAPPTVQEWNMFWTVVPRSSPWLDVQPTLPRLHWRQHILPDSSSAMMFGVMNLSLDMPTPLRGGVLLAVCCGPPAYLSIALLENSNVHAFFLPPILPQLPARDLRPNIYFLAIDSLTRMAMRKSMPRLRALFSESHPHHRSSMFSAFHTIAEGTPAAVFPFLYGGMDAKFTCRATRQNGRAPDYTEYIQKCVSPKRRLFREMQDAGYKTGVSSTFHANVNLPYAFFYEDDLDFALPFVPCPHYKARFCSEHGCFANGRYGDRFLKHNLRALSDGGESQPPVVMWSHLNGNHLGTCTADCMKDLDHMIVDHLESILQDEAPGSNGRLANTFVVVLGDHGEWKPTCARSRPFLGILAPRSLGTEKLATLHSNTDQLVTMWDLRATVRQLSGVASDSDDAFDIASLASRGPQTFPHIFRDPLADVSFVELKGFAPKSLLTPVPDGRSCREAGIPLAFCDVEHDPHSSFMLPCVKPEEMSQESSEALARSKGQIVEGLEGATCEEGRELALRFLKRVNSELRRIPQCKLFTFRHIELVEADFLVRYRVATNEGNPPRVFELRRVKSVKGNVTTAYTLLNTWGQYSHCTPVNAKPEWCVCGE